MSKKRSRLPARKAVRRASHRGLNRVSVAELQLEIRRRQRGTKSLHRKRAKLLEKVAAIDEQILAAAGA